MKAITVALLSVPSLSGLAGALLLAVVVWFFAPALLGVHSLWLLLLLVALPVLIWAAALVWLVRRAQKRDAALVAGVTQTDPAKTHAHAAAAAVSEEQRAMAARLADAFAAMKAAGGSGKGGYLYERPWYILIGPPGSGKSVAIRNSGLDFPLAEGTVSGVGGTRNCDWWISEQAVLIDTAGRYTTQDSDAETDSAGWQRFLDLLRRERPQQPLNGIVCVFGVDMLSRLTPATQKEHAQKVRSRIRELEQRLGQRLPVYLLISKTDLIAGFVEFFDDLDREMRRQVWGMTFAADPGPEGSVAGFREEFGALVDRLQSRVLERLQAERGAEQRASIAGFSAQFASLEGPLETFVKAAFGGSKLDPAPFLRGVYFTSGMQEGTPIDRLMGAVSRAFGLDSRRPAAVTGSKGRSYFLGRLLLDVVFKEARLAARDRPHDRRRRWVRLGVAFFSGLAMLVGAALGWYALGIENARQERVTQALDQAEARAKGLPMDKLTADDDLARMLPLLDAAQALPAAAAGHGGHLGLSQEAKLVGAGELSYRRVLERVMLPRMLARLKGQIRAGMQKPKYLYLATRVYLMLGRLGPLDRSLIKEWMAADWAQTYPGAVGAATVQKLMGHLDAMLDGQFETHPIDLSLVDEARRVFSRLPPAERVYERLRGSAADAAPWRPAQALGESGRRLFALDSGAPLADAAVPGLYTVEGLYRGVLPRLAKVIKEASEEKWVLGPDAAATASDQQLEQAVLELYARDYIAAWEKMLGGLVLVPFNGPAKATEALNLLSAPKSPLRDLLQSIAVQLSPGTPPSGVARSVSTAASAAAQGAPSVAGGMVPAVGGGGVAAAVGAAASAAVAGRVAEAIGLAAAVNPAGVVAKTVETHFAPLREAAGKLDGVLAMLNALYVQVARTATPGLPPAVAAPGLDARQRLLDEAKLAPPPLSNWLKVAARSSSDILATGTRTAVAAVAAQQLAPFCRGVETRFPFNSSPSAPDMPIADFVRLFGPGGALEQFFAQNLRGFVNTSQSPWRAVSPDGGPAPVSSADITQFQRAEVIRNAFFPAPAPGQPGSALRFELAPLALDPGAGGATIEVDGAKTSVAPGRQGGRGVTLQWPAQGSVALSFEGEPASSGIAYNGPWAALRFVARGRLQSTNVPDRMRLAMQLGARSADFELRTSSIVHPFGLRELADFRCPQLRP